MFNLELTFDNPDKKDRKWHKCEIYFETIKRGKRKIRKLELQDENMFGKSNHYSEYRIVKTVGAKNER